MLRKDDFEYSMENTKILHEPARRIATFGETRFEFHLISEMMDQVGVVRVRSGDVEAAKPLIMRPEPSMDMEGFSDEAREKLDQLLAMLKERGEDLAFLQYGFRFKRSNVKEQTYREPIENVREMLLEDVKKTGNPMLAIIEGVDDTWEVSLMKFAFELILQSHPINTFDLKRKKLL